VDNSTNPTWTSTGHQRARTRTPTDVSPSGAGKLRFQLRARHPERHPGRTGRL